MEFSGALNSTAVNGSTRPLAEMTFLAESSHNRLIDIMKSIVFGLNDTFRPGSTTMMSPCMAGLFEEVAQGQIFGKTDLKELILYER